VREKCKIGIKEAKFGLENLSST